jgi:two-component system, chemotaxis family, chemotaxis protein CheY
MARILIIEDNAPLAWLLERMLRGKYCITVMNNGLDALLWLAEGNTCDLIISDLQMPSVSGIELLENLKQSGLYSEIPVIILSAMEESVKECIALGAFCCIAKPFDPQKLLQQIKLALDASKKKEELTVH